ncbi:MAG TPA: hypothetical protein PLO67_14330 [Saprospiraceae bacterium]|nr:hypothetical protein [Saprospiraceae bacterium]HPI07127.1 hypothetical protein [Saprospiraceae bacterium]
MIKKIQVLFSLLLFLLCCQGKKEYNYTPITVDISKNLQRNASRPDLKGALEINIQNNDLSYILVERYQDHPDRPYYLTFNKIFILSGTLSDLRFYEGARTISERLPITSKDTIYKGEKRSYIFDENYFFTDSSDFVLFQLMISSPYFDSLNAFESFKVKTRDESYSIKSPFFIFHVSDDLIFTDTTKAFLSKYRDSIQPK